MIKVNDKEVFFLEGENLRDFLIRNDYDPDFWPVKLTADWLKKWILINLS
ncbi:hypothetical protein [Anaerococcus murdochii]|nr:hypothetical protein [Anaerococcus murdochii]